MSHVLYDLYQMNTIWPTRKVCPSESSSKGGFADGSFRAMSYPGEGNECNGSYLTAAEAVLMRLVLHHLMVKASLW